MHLYTTDYLRNEVYIMFNRRDKTDVIRIDCITEQRVMGKTYNLTINIS